MNQKVCVQCGKSFIPRMWKQQFCSHDCYVESLRTPKRTVICVWCHTKFESNRPTAKFCSHECRQIYKVIRMRISKLNSIRDLSSELEEKGKDFRFPKPHEALNKFYGLGDSS